MSLIEVKNLHKSYKNAIKDPGLKGAINHLFSPKYEQKIAVSNVNLTIEKGEAVAYIGTNGAGKSTTIKMLTGILIPTSGEIKINGLNPYKNRIENTKNIGVVFGQRTQLWWDIPIIESFRLLKEIYEIPEDDYKLNMELFGELLSINEFIHQPARKLSLGQRMRADIAASLLHNPPIVYLDEPTIGLDLAVKEKVHEFLQYLNREKGTTILLTSHDLTDIEKLCKRIVIIDKGTIIYDDSIERIKGKLANERKISLTVNKGNVPIEKIKIGLKDTVVNYDGKQQITIQFDQNNITAYKIVEYVMQIVSINDFSIEETSLEQVIKKVYNGDLLDPRGPQH